ncbi:hypothetical protein GUITHDRAFT_134049 [Guillardia theta CCMP2712]|uniref:RRM domain-containing protein n=1 Tax=Guillardia theta (strain CCMP2712) TaxID=905079 RepID=L1JVG8_GUITC|nr:hypothetical protein GUITHDRAFT_134049 [Guillardia theta CCMP2712]EKX52372.1 hypothetical protein GUITHDRAFT_134049 [Guillardia theta CCMP2712]|eukprot:XP_005839352.1 hypothetical protein GUITHDRAFT_134049 [Guillardia theta CCMP2712]
MSQRQVVFHSTSILLLLLLPCSLLVHPSGGIVQLKCQNLALRGGESSLGILPRHETTRLMLEPGKRARENPPDEAASEGKADEETSRFDALDCLVDVTDAYNLYSPSKRKRLSWTEWALELIQTPVQRRNGSPLFSRTTVTGQRRIAFYFSDSNLPRDKFLQFEMGRMKTLRASVRDIAEGARRVDYLEVSPDGQWVRRTTPVLDQDALTNRTIYVDGFKSTDVGQLIENAQEAFDEYGKVLSVRAVRHFRTKQLTGAVFVEFENENVAREVVETLQLQDDGDFQVCMKADWKRIERRNALVAKRTLLGAGRKALLTGLTMVAEQNKKHKNLPNYIKGAWIRLTDLHTNATKQEIALVFGRFGRVKNVDYHGQNNSAVIFYSTSHAASEAVKSYEIEDSPVVCGTRPRVTLIQVSDFPPSFALVKVSQGEDEEWENLKYGTRVQKLNQKMQWWRKKFEKAMR